MTTHNIRKIAGSVDVIAQLPSGDALVSILGNGSEQSNFEALTTWVGYQTDLLALEDSYFMVERLINRLMDRFDNLNAALSQ